jgi:hypothetical protein
MCNCIIFHRYHPIQQWTSSSRTSMMLPPLQNRRLAGSCSPTMLRYSCPVCVDSASLTQRPHLVVPQVRQRKTAARAPLQHVQHMLLAHGSPLPVGCRMRWVSESQIFFEFPGLYQCTARLRHSDATRDSVELLHVLQPFCHCVCAPNDSATQVPRPLAAAHGASARERHFHMLHQCDRELCHNCRASWISRLFRMFPRVHICAQCHDLGIHGQPHGQGHYRPLPRQCETCCPDSAHVLLIIS